MCERFVFIQGMYSKRKMTDVAPVVFIDSYHPITGVRPRPLSSPSAGEMQRSVTKLSTSRKQAVMANNVTWRSKIRSRRCVEFKKPEGWWNFCFAHPGGDSANNLKAHSLHLNRWRPVHTQHWCWHWSYSRRLFPTVSQAVAEAMEIMVLVLVLETMPRALKKSRR